MDNSFTQPKDIFSYVKAEENGYQTMPIAVIDGMEWSMYEHIRLSTLYKNSTYKTGKNDNKPFKNITRPILNLQYRAEGFDVKDIILFVDDKDDYYKSFLVKKFHEKWARQNGIDTFIDDMVESYVDYGGALIKDVNDVKPVVVPLQSIAFCDQTDLLSGPLALKHFYAPDELKDMAEFGWGDEKNGATMTIDDVIQLSQNEKKIPTTQTQGRQTRTPGKYIEVYEVHGVFPDYWMDNGIDEAVETPDTEYTRQLHIICFYTTQENERKGITLFKGKEKESIFKLVLRDKVYGRALGMGGAEELFEPQVWVNYDIIRIKGMLDVASKVIFQTADPAFANRNKTTNIENGEILITELNMPLTPVNTQPVNITVFENSIKEWEAHAQQMGAANDSIMGEPPTAGTPFKLQELVTQEAHSLHEYRKGKLATFLDEVYRDWIIPYLSKEITKGQEFLTELDLDELQQVADNLIVGEANNYVKAKILAGQSIDPGEVDQYKQLVREGFMKGGNKRFMEILKGELKDAPMDVEINIVGKQKNLSQMVDKISNVIRQIIQSPQILQDPTMAKLFNQLIEASGLEPLDFSSYKSPMQPNQPQPNQQPSLVPMGQPTMANAQ